MANITNNFTHDFNDGNGLVPACRHVNPNGSKGGWVADTAKVEATVYVWPDAAVFGYAQVSENARVYGYAQVYGSARVYGDAQVCGFAWVYGDARVYERAQVSG